MWERVRKGRKRREKRERDLAMSTPRKQLIETRLLTQEDCTKLSPKLAWWSKNRNREHGWYVSVEKIPPGNTNKNLETAWERGAFANGKMLCPGNESKQLQRYKMYNLLYVTESSGKTGERQEGWIMGTRNTGFRGWAIGARSFTIVQCRGRKRYKKTTLILNFAQLTPIIDVIKDVHL